MNLNINMDKAIDFITEYKDYNFIDVLDCSITELLEFLDNTFDKYKNIFKDSKYYIDSKNLFKWDYESSIYSNIQDMEQCIYDLAKYALNILKCEVNSYEL